VTTDPAGRPARRKSAAPARKPAFTTSKAVRATARVPRRAAASPSGPRPEAGPETEATPESEPAATAAAPSAAREPAPAASAPDSAPAPGPTPGAAALPQLARVLGGVVAPTTLLTALLYYFGWLHAYYLFGYFGVNSTTLGFGTADYLMRAVDGLYIPLAVAAIAGLLALWGNAALLPALHAGSPRLRSRFLRSVSALGIALAVAGGTLTLLIGAGSSGYDALAPVGFAAGVIVLGYAVHLRRVFGAVHVRRVVRQPGQEVRPASGWAEAAEWMISFFLVAISLFGAASDYAGGVGEARARQLEAELPLQPAVVLYSQRSLDLPLTGITRTRCANADAGYQYRYDGLVLVLESGGKYLLLPRQWTPYDGNPAILLAESDAIRLEFYPGTVAPAPSPTAC
jgi:hypothetical protein